MLMYINTYSHNAIIVLQILPIWHLYTLHAYSISNLQVNNVTFTRQFLCNTWTYYKSGKHDPFGFPLVFLNFHAANNKAGQTQRGCVWKHPAHELRVSSRRRAALLVSSVMQHDNSATVQ